MKHYLLVVAASYATVTGVLAVPVTFQVDMSHQASLGTFDPATDRVDARGSFNNWSTGFALAATVEDPLIFKGVFDVPGAAGANIEYKFVKVIGGSDTWESISNRSFALAGEAQTLPISFFNNEWAGDPLNVTFQVNMATQMAANNFKPADGDVVQVRGEFNGWSSGFILEPSQENPDIYVGTTPVPQAPGSAVQYKFHIQRVGNPEIWENDPNRRFMQLEADQTLSPVYFNNVTGVPIKGELSVTVDMTAQIAGGRFDPATQEVWVRGNKFGWGNPPEGVQLVEDESRSGVYTNTITRDVITGETAEFKFTIWDPVNFQTVWEDGANKTVVFTGSEPKNAEGAYIKTFGPHFFNSIRPEDILAEDTVVTFRVDMNGAQRFGGGAVFDPATEGVWINGPWASNGNWGPWNSQDPNLEMFDDGLGGGDATAGDKIYSYQTTFVKGSPTRVVYKYGINSGDNEAGMGNDHVRYIRSTGNYVMPVDTFGTMTVETLGIGEITISRGAAGRIVLNWTGQPGVRLQRIADLGNIAGATDVPGTEGQSAVDLPAEGSMGFFRLYRP